MLRRSVYGLHNTACAHAGACGTFIPLAFAAALCLYGPQATAQQPAAQQSGTAAAAPATEQRSPLAAEGGPVGHPQNTEADEERVGTTLAAADPSPVDPAQAQVCQGVGPSAPRSLARTQQAHCILVSAQ